MMMKSVIIKLDHISNSYIVVMVGVLKGCQYSTVWGGNFRGVLILVIFVVDLADTKFSTHEN